LSLVITFIVILIYELSFEEATAYRIIFLRTATMLRFTLLRLAAYGLLYGRLATAGSTVAYTVDTTNRKGSRSSQSLYEKRKKVL